MTSSQRLKKFAALKVGDRVDADPIFGSFHQEIDAEVLEFVREERTGTKLARIRGTSGRTFLVGSAQINFYR